MPEFDGKCFIFSAPSGSGKTTIVQHLLSNNSNLGFSISACTRDRRGRNEENGKDYYFLSIEQFKEHIAHDDFVEWEEVYAGAYYGTLKSEVERLWSQGKHIIFDVDVRGGLALKKYFGKKGLSIFVKVPTTEMIEQRLRDRGTETEESISARLYKLKFELEFEDQFDISLLNEHLDETLVNAQQLFDDFVANRLHLVK